MKVILDTNVLVSGIFFGGVPGRILSAWAAGEVALVLSPAILDEYRRVGAELATRYPDLEAALEPVLALLAMNASIVDAPPLVDPVSEDPADDMFLKHLLRVSGWRGITVLKPRPFMDQYLAGR